MACSPLSSELILNLFNYDETASEYTIAQAVYNVDYPNQQGLVHDGQYRPTGLKYERKTHEACSDYNGSQHLNGLLPKEGEELVPVMRIASSLCLYHIFVNIVWIAGSFWIQ
jgi:hypothetical protein